MKPLNFLFLLSVGWACSQVQAARITLSEYKRILFLGDSITHAGHYVSYIETWLRQNERGLPELIQIGLPSETCTGLSEPEHPWPRPNVHERLRRALRKTDPDLVFAGYGMNDGIYHPFSPERFATFQQGLEKLIDEVDRHGAKLILLTPPPFDPMKLRGTPKLRPSGAATYAWSAIYEDYDEVVKSYSQHVLLKERDKRVLAAVDLHTAVTEALAKERKTVPEFSFHPDGVHLNAEGHKVMAAAILRKCQITEFLEDLDGQLYKRVHERQCLLHYSWLSHVGHKRPGIKAGIALPEAQKQAKVLEVRIQDIINSLVDKSKGRP